MGLWSTQTSISPTREDAGGDVYNGLYYLCGGSEAAAGGGIPDHQSFNPSTNTWTARAVHKANNGTTYGVYYHSAQTSGSNIHHVGGTNSLSPNYDYWRQYSASGNTWTQGANASSPMSNEAMFSEQVSGTGYFFGGYGTAASTKSYAYNFSTHAFTAKAALPAATYFGGTTLESATVSTVIHCYGGGNGTTYSSAHRAYTPSSNTWTTKAALPTARTLEGAALIVPGTLGVPVIFGGSGSVQPSDVWSWSPTTNTWTQRPPNLPAPHAWGVSFSLATDRANLVSGQVGGNESGTNTYWNADNAPNPPTLNLPIAGAAIDPGAAQTFTWTFSDPDVGDTQTAYALSVKDITTAGAQQWWNATTQAWQATEVFNAGTTGSVTIPANKFTVGDTYQWTVATTDAKGPSNGAYAAWRTFVGSIAPQVTVLAPAGDGNVTSLTTQRAYWSYTQAAGNPQTNYQIKVFSYATVNGGGFDPNTSPTVWDSGQVASAATSAYLQGLANDSTYYLYVRAASNGPNWSAWTSSRFLTSTGAALGTATRLQQTVEYVFEQLTTQEGRPVPDVDTDAAVQNSVQPITRLALGATDYNPTGTESGGVVPGEVFAGGTLDSAVAGAVSHTVGTSSYTLQQNWTADNPATLYTVGVLNNMPYDMAPGQPRYLAGSSNQRRLMFIMRLPNPVVAGVGDSFETDVTVTF